MLYRQGYVRAIGVSNFYEHHLKDILENFEVIPAVNQVELHPMLTLEGLRSFCRQHNIQVEAWSPLMQGHLDNPVLAELAKKYGKSPAQIVLRWDIQSGIVTIPKSSRESRIRENAGIFDFELSLEDIRKIDALNEEHHFGAHPDHFNF
jgi:diketogulonate reductase-like aldo/keto reductase